MGATVTSGKDQPKGWIEQLGFDSGPVTKAEQAVGTSKAAEPKAGNGGLADLEDRLKWMKAHAKALEAFASAALAAAKTIAGLTKKVSDPADVEMVNRAAAYYQAKAVTAAQQLKSIQ